MVETCVVCKEVVHLNRHGRIYPHATYQHGTQVRCATSQMTMKAAKVIFKGEENETVQNVKTAE